MSHADLFNAQLLFVNIRNLINLSAVQLVKVSLYKKLLLYKISLLYKSFQEVVILIIKHFSMEKN